MQAAAPNPGPQQQLHLALFTAHELDAWEQEDRRKRLRKQSLSTTARKRFWISDEGATRNLFESIDVAMLDQPLGVFDASNELNCDIDPLSATVEEADAPSQSPEGDKPEEWSEAAVAQLHEAVLHYSLKALQARGNGAEKREILEWIFAPPPMIAVLPDDSGELNEVVLPQPLIPFSFERCCRVCGYSSERLTDGLMPILRAMGLGNVFNEIANGHTTNETEPDPAEVSDPGNLQPA
jgi:hypothetical protein